MRHQERVRAVGKHYWQTLIYGPTGHAIGGTAQQALLSFYCREHSQASTIPVTTTGQQRPVGVWTSPTAAAGARATRNWRMRTGATPCDGTDDYATAGSGPTRQSRTLDSESTAGQFDAACRSALGIYYSDFLNP
jgi:hypothetical protein